jgi:hypothetical protein
MKTQCPHERKITAASPPQGGLYMQLYIRFSLSKRQVQEQIHCHWIRLPLSGHHPPLTSKDFYAMLLKPQRTTKCNLKNSNIKNCLPNG